MENSLVVVYEPPSEKDNAVLIVGKEINDRIEMVSHFLGKEAEEMYERLLCGGIANR